jgi:acyl-CoA hydrolase
MIQSLQDLHAATDLILQRVAGPLRVGAPLGLGKPHRLLNALYARVAADPSRPMQLYTALSLDPPGKAAGLEGRFLGPFARRHFGEDFPRLAYVEAMRRDALPAHIQVEEFYMQSGAMLSSRQAQRAYTSLNYTMAADGVAMRAPNLVVQKVAREPGGTRLSLSCNNDLTQDLLDAIARRSLPRPLMVAEVDPALPWIGGSATVSDDFFDVVVDPPAPHPKLFALPRQPVNDADYAIGLYASTLVRDGGTLQIGIGTLADALSHALVLRHTDNARYRAVLRALDPTLESHPLVRDHGGLDPFVQGLYGCSEMLNEGFRRLVQTGVIHRRVHDDVALMQRLHDGTADADDHARLQREGEFLHGAFYLGSAEFYDWLRENGDGGHGIGMRRISEINQLYGGHEALERLQRRDARFFNSCMIATALGAAASDGLEDGRIVSGVGGQYNFVAMAHALEDARSVLILRASRTDGAGKVESDVRWQYGHTTIPRHLRDIYVDQYGIADLLGATDEDCVVAMTAIAELPFQQGLLDAAKAARKLREDFVAPAAWQRNTPEALAATLAPFRADGTLPDYPLGSDFTDVEQRLLRALTWLKQGSTTWRGKLRLLAGVVTGALADDAAALQRMDLHAPAGIGERLQARLVRHALARTAR